LVAFFGVDCLTVGGFFNNFDEERFKTKNKSKNMRMSN
jgi:hypothetical protein